MLCSIAHRQSVVIAASVFQQNEEVRTCQLISVPLSQAPGDDHLLHLAILLELCCFHDGLHQE